MWEYNNTNELMHYGVLGMKWGKRKGSVKSIGSKVKGVGKKLTTPSGVVTESRETTKQKAKLNYLKKERKALNKQDQNSRMAKMNRRILDSRISRTKTSLALLKYEDEYRAGTSYVERFLDALTYEEGGAAHYAQQRAKTTKIQSKLKK